MKHLKLFSVLVFSLLEILCFVGAYIEGGLVGGMAGVVGGGAFFTILWLFITGIYETEP